MRARAATYRPRPKYRAPDVQIKEQDERRLEIRELAKLQAIATGEAESDVVEALVIQEAAERGRGDAELALCIFDGETERIAQDEQLDSFTQIIAILEEAAEEFEALDLNTDN